MNHESLNLDQIKMENPYLRLGTDVSTLERSIETIGLISPIIVNKENILIAGARRWQAMKNLGYESAPIIRVDVDNLQQELMSIDENLVRKSLTTPEIEQHLSRAKEIYGQLARENEDFKAQVLEKRQKRLSEIPQDQSDQSESDEPESFDDIVSDEFAHEVGQKSSLSTNQIKKAIEREQKSSEDLRQARGRGEVSVSQANELIRLQEEDQKIIIPHIRDKTVKELRKLVKDTRAHGAQRAIEENQSIPCAREFRDLITIVKKASKLSEYLKLEGVEMHGEIQGSLERYWPSLKSNMQSLLGDCDVNTLEEQGFHPEYLSTPDSTSSDSMDSLS